MGRSKVNYSSEQPRNSATMLRTSPVLQPGPLSAAARLKHFISSRVTALTPLVCTGIRLIALFVSEIARVASVLEDRQRFEVFFAGSHRNTLMRPRGEPTSMADSKQSRPYTPMRSRSPAAFERFSLVLLCVGSKTARLQSPARCKNKSCSLNDRPCACSPLPYVRYPTEGLKLHSARSYPGRIGWRVSLSPVMT